MIIFGAPCILNQINEILITMTLDPQGCMHSGFHKLCNFDIRRHHNLWYHGIQGENDSTVHVYCTLYSTGQNTDVKKSLSLEYWCFLN